MGFSIFTDTMADLTFQQVEEAAQQRVPVLFPIAVIEEHGPHLPLGTDTYLAYQVCMGVKRGLERLGQPSLVAPPFYWGINQATSGFGGSFTVRPQTLIDILCDTLVCL
ncbi:MAG: creatininase family protein, partial [Chloroflexota bacterium]